MLSEMQAVCQYAAENSVDVETVPPHVIGNYREKTNQRKFNEVALRLYKLDPLERKLLIESNSSLAKQVALVACIRTYAFLKDFMHDVITVKASLYDFTITERDYNSFVSRTSLEHPEVDALSPNTRKKVKQVLLRILADAQFIDSVKTLNFNPHYLERSLKTHLLRKGNDHEVNLLLG